MVTAGIGVLAGVELRDAGFVEGVIGVDIACGLYLLDERCVLESLSKSGDERKKQSGV